MAQNELPVKHKEQLGGKIWRAALYVRLSREDGDKTESDSVVNQRALLTEFARLERDVEPYGVYIDDGWSGTNFDRPEFARMMKDLNSGEADCVIVKDLSRFGRNYIDVGQYLEKVFPAMDVRFISVTDNLDSVKNPQTMNNIIVPFKNLINDEYCRDISNKVRSSLDMKRKQGKFIGAFACYGYMKDKEDRNKLLPDPVAGEVVKDIFSWFIGGASIIGIAKRLNAAGTPNPTLYKQQQGLHYRHPAGKINDGLWPDSSVRRILTNRTYTGALVQGRNKIKSYKLPVSQPQPEEDWIIVEGTHEALISEEEFEKAQSLMKRRTRTAPGKQTVHLFSGFVRCGDCRKAMARKLISQPYAEYCYFVCSTFKKMDKSACTKHTIRSDRLEEMVLAALRSQIALAADMDAALKAISECKTRKRNTSGLREQLKSAHLELDRAEELILGLYPDWKAGIISQTEYQKLKAGFEKQAAAFTEKIKTLEKRLDSAENGDFLENDFVRRFAQFKNIERLTREALVALVDAIYVYENRDIRIDFKYRDPFSDAMDYIARNRELLDGEPRSETATA